MSRCRRVTAFAAGARRTAHGARRASPHQALFDMMIWVMEIIFAETRWQHPEFPRMTEDINED